MTLLDEERPRQNPGWDMIEAIRREAHLPYEESIAEESVFTVARDRRRLRATVRALCDGLAEQVIRTLEVGIDHPSRSAEEHIRGNLRAMGPGQLKGMMQIMRDRPVFVPRDAIESDLVSTLRSQLRG